MLLNYKQIGQGYPIILIHGLFGSLDNLGQTAKVLADNFTVINIDMPDHGHSFHSTQFSYQHYAHCVIALLDHLNISEAHFLGHSMGGKVAMQLALDFPHRASKLILADIAPVQYQPRHDKVFKALNNVPLNEITGRSDALNAMMMHLDETGVAQFLLKSLNQDQGIWSWKFNLPFLRHNYPLISAAIDVNTSYDGPTLFIKGGNSDYITQEHQPFIQRIFPNAKAKIIAGTGHWLHAEKPVIFNKIVTDFALD